MRKLALLGVVLATSAHAQFNAHQFLTVGDTAYVVGFPEVVASGAEFSQLRFTPGGRYLAFTQRDLGMSGRRASQATIEAKVEGKRAYTRHVGLVWDDQLSKLFRIPVDADYGGALLFTDRLMVFQTPQGLQQLNPATGTLVPYKAANGFRAFRVSHGQKAALLFNSDQKSYLLLTENGTRAIPAPPAGWFYSLFEADGKGLIMMGEPPAGPPYRRYDLATGHIEPINHFGPPNSSDLDPAPFGLHQLGQPIGRLFAKDQKPRDPSAGNLGAYLGESVVSTDGKKVAYTLNGCVFIADILSVSSKDLIAMRNEEGKASAISNAKQLNTSLQIYMSNNDDRMPGPQGLREKLRPYLQNDALFNTLVYTYNGPEKSTDVEDPSKTAMGYVQGPGGKAVMYVDGHVVWVPDP